MLEKIFVKQNRWEMTKWMKKNQESFPDDYLVFRIFLYLNYIGVLISLSGVIFMILFLTGVFFNYFTLTLWLVLFIGGLSLAMIGNRMQLPIFHKFLLDYVKDQSIPVDFNVNEWIYRKKYFSIKAYKYGLISSIIAYFPLTLFFTLTLSLLLDFFIVLIIAYFLLSLLILTNLPILFLNSNIFHYSTFNEPLIGLYGLFTSLSLTLTFKSVIFWIIGILIMGLYWLIFLGIWRKLIIIAENDVQDSILSDLINYLKVENEVVLKYWKWIQPRRYLIEELMKSGKLKNVELTNKKIIKKN